MTTWADFWGAVLPPLAVALLALLSAMVSLAVSYLRAMQRKYDETANREALHSAATTGVRAALLLDPHASNKEIMASSAKYIASTGAPDVAKKMKTNDLNQIVASKITEERERNLPVEIRPSDINPFGVP